MGITEELRHTAAKLVTAGKFAVGSALSQVGFQVHDIIVKGELKGGSPWDGNMKKNLVMVEEMKQQQDMNNMQQQRRNGDNEDHLKRLFEEPPLSRKIFIRSRL